MGSLEPIKRNTNEIMTIIESKVFMNSARKSVPNAISLSKISTIKNERRKKFVK